MGAVCDGSAEVISYVDMQWRLNARSN
ncbi:TPA: hypothetical protein N0F65_010962 [Lagenidium giganteum]|uniref:Uncharacterized protein n=1 Tax=Lagenidium giganteum TaxID=4803 RepID=A0AAV2Z9A8_9STRA|nr:TPA: hypothetical protein N0F65_010962 [Lagenidium giganteum]